MGQLIAIIAVVLFFFWVFKGYRRYETSEYSRDQFRGFVLSKEALAQSELGLFVALVAKVAKADGRIDELEAELIGNMFNDISALFPDPANTKEFLKEIFNTEKQLPYNLDEKALSLFAYIKNDPHKKQQMMAFMINLAYIDGTLSHTEEAMIRKISSFLHFDPSALEAMLEQFGSLHRHAIKESSISSAYKLLGIGEDTSNDEIKKAYRNLVKQYHPDIIKAQGADENYLKESTIKVQEINAAYEMIKKSRGI